MSGDYWGLEVAVESLKAIEQRIARLANAQRRADAATAERIAPRLREALRMQREIKHHIETARRSLALAVELELAASTCLTSAMLELQDSKGGGR